jgi:hypothetical protein
MPLPIYRLRRWLAVIAVLFTATVSGMYFYARLRQRNVLKEIPNKIGIDIKQTANGFQFSKSDGKRTLFTVQADSLKQFQLDGSAELHHVSVILYGRDSSRFDQIYGTISPMTRNPATSRLTETSKSIWNPIRRAEPDRIRELPENSRIPSTSRPQTSSSIRTAETPSPARGLTSTHPRPQAGASACSIPARATRSRWFRRFT